MPEGSLKAIHETQDEIPDIYRDLYTERGGKWELTGIAGVKTQNDVDRVKEALEKEKKDHKAAKDSARVWLDSGYKIEEVRDRMDKWDEIQLKLENAGKLNDDQIDKIVEGRIKSRLGPVERDKASLAEQLSAAVQRVAAYEEKERITTIHSEARKARVKTGAYESAEEDINAAAERMLEITDDGRVVTKDGVGVTPGVEADVWLQEMQTKRAHWWPPSEGGGAKGAKVGITSVKNPWSAAHWNITEQGNYINANGIEKAQQMAALAGSKIGATRPTVKAA